ncbi:unnamed protein product [Phaedon cochleariae]|uniref:Hermansky-Pudlak syndrome 5 protein homolog n=1 Tax=Phaedon cochleariae TaxID=80249 RepID=A0A9P0DT14_PHACE|nr:unnamed protein product [Phaedon cochleariae]
MEIDLPKMEKHVLVEYLSNVKSVICETFKSMQRIKLTSFDVSPFYIIFGTSSGGIYIFKRSPCQFLRIIPSKEGSTIQVAISPNEKHLAVASSRGLVVILENFFVDMSLRPLIHIEHEGNTLTVMKWHGNDLYCGDHMGKISVFTVATLLTKAIFQTPSATLMQLDSTIIQIDTYKHYLLISTKTRTYLCDTDKEHFKQIGKKLRDGHFGACFYHISNTAPNETYHSSRATFKTIKDNEQFSSSINNGDAKIFCARPGARIWQVNFEASVLATYQLRDTLNQGSLDVIHIEDCDTTRLNMSGLNGASISKNFSFGKIYLLCQRFIFSYDNEGMYFFDPAVSSVAFWSPTLKNIIDVRILNSHIYVWCNGLHLHIISLQSLESLLISTLMKKQYYLCAELCLHFEKDVKKLLEYSKNIHLLRHLNVKLVEFGMNDLFEKLKPVLNMLEEQYKKQNSEMRLNNKSVFNENCDMYLPRTVETLNQRTTLVVKNSVMDRGDDEEGKKYVISIYKQYLLNKTHRKAELTETSNIFNMLNLDDLLPLLEDFTRYVEEKDNECASTWCQEQLLKQAVKGEIESIQTKTLICLTEAFFTENSNKELSCQCSFPLPKAHTRKLEHYNLASKLFDMSTEKNEFLSKIPQIHKHRLSKLSNLHDLMLNLPILTQFSDKEVFKEHVDTLTYDGWEEIVKLYIKLRQKLCLNCGRTIDNENALSWTEIGMLIIESIGSRNANRLMGRYAQCIPNGELDAKFYQSCIFTMTCEEPGVGIHFMENVVNNDNFPKFGDLMEKFLQKKYLGNQSHITTKLNSNDLLEVCSYCKLSIKGPVLSEIKKCDKGHNFHSICFLHSSNFCNVCMLAS